MAFNICRNWLAGPFCQFVKLIECAILKNLFYQLCILSAAYTIYELPGPAAQFCYFSVVLRVKPYQPFVLFYLCRQYTRHKSFVGGQIDSAVLEMWEESLDGSGKIANLANSFLLYYSTVTSCYLIRKREHAKYLSALYSRLSYYTLVSWFEDTDDYNERHFSRIINPLFDGST